MCICIHALIYTYVCTNQYVFYFCCSAVRQARGGACRKTSERLKVITKFNLICGRKKQTTNTFCKHTLMSKYTYVGIYCV